MVEGIHTTDGKNPGSWDETVIVELTGVEDLPLHRAVPAKTIAT
jgi:hypothetical protein